LPLWLFVMVFVAAGLAVLGALSWLVLRDPRAERPRYRGAGRPLPAAGEPESEGVRAGLWHVVEEFLPPVADQPGRWVEVGRNSDHAGAMRLWSRLVAETGGDPEPYRIVSTATPAPLRRAARSSSGTPAVRVAAAGPGTALGADAGYPVLPFQPRPARDVPAPYPRGSSSEQESAVTFTSDAPDDVPLYERLVRFARTDGVFALVSERLYDRILGPRGTDPSMTGDPYLVPFFRNADGSLIDRDRLERHMTHFLMAALGGPKRYTGRGMAAAHAGRGITGEAFDRVIGHVVAVLTGLGVPAGWIGEVGAAVEPLRVPVVTAGPTR